MAGLADAINEIYQEELGGNADAGGLAFYTGLAEAGVPLSEIQAQINASPEGQAYDASGQAGFGRETISYAGEPSAYDVAVSSGKLKKYTPPAIKGTAAEQSLQNNYNAVLDAYQREYGRPPSGNELIDIGNRLAGGESATNLISQIASSPEAQIFDVYGSQLGRDPRLYGDIGIDYYLNQIGAGQRTLEETLAQIQDSPEAILRGVYFSELGRDPREGGDRGIDEYLRLIEGGDKTLDQVIADIQNSPEAQAYRAEQSKIIARPPTGPYGGTSQYGSQPGLAAIPAPISFLPAGGRTTLATTPYDAGSTLQGPLGLFRPTTTGTAPTVPVPVPVPVPAPVAEAPAEGMKEGGMAKATPAELGSKFDISEFIDEEGRLVGGYSQPIRDEYGVITGYNYRPYESDVVFGEELRSREAARQMTPEERARALLNMQVMSGRTGVSPIRGGLEGIEVRGPASRATPKYYPFAKGGLADIAQDLASKGRYGDTMVAHISPQEAGLLKAMGGAGTVNPETGLPEFFSLFPKKGIKLNLGPLGNIKVGAKSSNILQAAAALAAGQYLPPMFNAAPLTVGQTALAYGGLRGLSTGNLMEGIQAGLTAYGMGSAYNAYADPSNALGPGGLGTGTGPVDPGAGAVAPEASGQVLSQNVPLESPLTAPGVGDNVSLSALERAELGIRPPMTSPSQFTAASQAAEATRAGFPLSDPQLGGIPDLSAPLEIQAVSPENAAASASQGFLGRNLPPAVQEYTPKFLLDASGTTLATGTVLGGSLLAGQQARAAAAGRNAAIAREQEDKKRRFRDLAQNLQQQYPFEYAKGGLASLAGGGMTYMEAGGTTGPTGTPRDVTGTGDGMSDSVPATIEGVQEARLADGEFVIPADVVADIGNGSSDAGSKKLYDMMDRIRMARHGTKEQPPEIKAERLMPA